MSGAEAGPARGRVHPAVPFLLFAPVAAAAVGLGWRRGLAPGSLVGLVAAGWLAWTLVEYALHRWVFHWRPRSARLRAWVGRLHQAHHETQEWDRLVAHPLFALPLALLFLGAFLLVLGPAAGLASFGGLTVGYLVYEWIHVRSHFGRPRTRWMRSLRRRHLQHHFARPDRWYGVSWPVWDYVFRTHVPGR